MRFNKTLTFLLILALMMPLALITQAQDDGEIVIQNIWARPSAMGSPMMNQNDNAGEGMQDQAGEGMQGMQGQGTSAAYMLITNNTENTVSLVGGGTDVAALVEIHENVIDENQVMRMRPVDGGITVAPGETVELRPGGLHVMLMDLQEEIELETAFNLGLMFESRDAEGNVVGDPIEMMLGVPVLDMMEPPTQTDLVLEQVWARPTAAMMEHDHAEGDMAHEDEAEESEGMAEMGDNGYGVSAVFMYITNNGDEDVSLVGGETDIANIIEIHETRMTDEGVMQMRPLMDGLVIPAGETVELRPGGYHVMLMDLQDNLYESETLYLTLEFSNGETIVVGAPIQDRMGMMMDE